MPLPNYEQLLSVLKQYFPGQAGTIIIVIAVLAALWAGTKIASEIVTNSKSLFPSWFKSAEEKRRITWRRRFASHVEAQIRGLNDLEAWSDYRFAELEAEVEAEGRRRRTGAFSLPWLSRSGLRRERSLSKALETSQERLILLEGEPGSGKSVALRYVAQSMSKKAMHARTINSIIPIYINLKELKPNKGEEIDRNLIERFVLMSLNRANSRDIEEFLENEFKLGMQNGTWLFLFDSFDEIPDILSSTEADAIIKKYSDAIDNFLNRLNACRGIVASRQFRGPKQTDWPRFHILKLSERRRAELVRKSDLNTGEQSTLIGQLGIAGEEIRDMVNNPMFLGLLCEYMHTKHSFPQNAHIVYETYVQTRLTRDEERLQRRFKLKTDAVRAMAENVAFCMATEVPLTAPRDRILTALKKLEFPGPRNFQSQLDALEYIKLARSETTTVAGDAKPFTFAHRRFQEYFATCVVLHEQKRVAARLLLTDARWRETAVVICQTQPANLLQPIIKEAKKILGAMKKNVPELIDDPVAYVQQPESDLLNEDRLPKLFSWPSGFLHLAGLLQDGFVNRLKDLPDDIRNEMGRILLTASRTGTLSDRKWAMEVAGTLPSSVLLWLLRDAFASGSQWLAEVAFRQTARLGQIPGDVAQSIRRAVLSLFATGRLDRELDATYAHLARLDQSSQFIASLRLLQWTPFIDLGIHILIAILLIVGYTYNGAVRFDQLLWVIPVSILLIILSVGSLRHIAGFYLSFGKQAQHSKADWVFLGLMAGYLRIGVSLLCYVLAAEILPTPLLLAVLFLSWAPFALLAALTGLYVHPAWWLVMPAWPLLYFVTNLQKSINNVGPWLRKSWKGLILGLVGTALIFAVGVILPTSVYLIIYIPLGLVGVGAMVAGTVYWIKDWLRWRAWRRTKRAAVTADEFLQILTDYNNVSFRNRFIKAVRERELLEQTEHSKFIINSLGLEVDREIATRKKKMLDNSKKPFYKQLQILLIDPLKQTSKLYLPGGGSFRVQTQSVGNPTSTSPFESWLTKYQRHNKEKLAKWGNDFRDELWKLSEQIQANKQQSE